MLVIVEEVKTGGLSLKPAEKGREQETKSDHRVRIGVSECSH